MTFAVSEVEAKTAKTKRFPMWKTETVSQIKNMYIGMEIENKVIGGETNPNSPAIVGNLGTITAIEEYKHVLQPKRCRSCFQREPKPFEKYCEFCEQHNLVKTNKVETVPAWKFAVLILICLIFVGLRFCDFQPVAAMAEKNVR